jgi:hypothetical protein
MRRGRIFKTAPRFVLAVAVGAIVALGLGTCQMLGVTKMDRLSQFGADLSGDKSQMSANFAPGQTADYALVGTQAYWDAIGVVLPGAFQTYSLSVHDYVDPANVTADIYGPPTFYNFDVTWPVGGPIPARFVLVQIDTDWFIREIYLNGSVTPAVK